MKIYATILLLFIFIAPNCCLPSKKITFKVVANSTADTSEIFITGNDKLLGDWYPDKIKMDYKNDQIWQISFSFPLDTKLEFKFTRGSWDSEALDESGGVPSNHVHTVKQDTTITFKINMWKDNFMGLNSRKITGDFEIHQQLTYPGLKPRDVIVWLPPGYKKNPDKKYPVMYMHDGQNLFDPTTSFLGNDWQVDETADSLIRGGEIEPLIIVGIYNTGDRREEYSYLPLGKKYANFVINRLKPFIDKKYRTLPDARHTAVGGSSMGGLISFILVWEYQNIFSKAICMSPAFKLNDFDYVKEVQRYTGPKKNIKIYIDNGGLDLEKKLQPGIDDILKILKQQGYILNKDMFWFKDKSAPHNELAWAQRFWRPLSILYKK